MSSTLKNLGIAIGIAALLFILQNILSFFNITFYNNNSTFFYLLWFITLILFYFILPKGYPYFKKNE